MEAIYMIFLLIVQVFGNETYSIINLPDNLNESLQRCGGDLCGQKNRSLKTCYLDEYKCICGHETYNYYDSSVNCKVDQNDDCIDDVQCKEPFKCVRSKCKCDDDQIYHNYECLNIVYDLEQDNCIISLQCSKFQYSLCGSNRKCRCAFGKRLINNQCRLNNNTDQALQVYKITMIFASTCLALVLLIFLACILKKSYCPNQVPIDPVLPDIFTVYNDGIGNGTSIPYAPPFEKPPSYDETVQIMRQEIGIPPPGYLSRENSTRREGDPGTSQGVNNQSFQE